MRGDERVDGRWAEEGAAEYGWHGSFPLRFYIFPSSYFKRRFSLTLKTEVRFY
jgi:hypothetical protein